MASAKTGTKPKSGTKTKTVAPATSGAEFWARAFMRPEDLSEFLKRLDEASSAGNWDSVAIDMGYLSVEPPREADWENEPLYDTAADLLDYCTKLRGRVESNRENGVLLAFYVNDIMSLWPEMNHIESGCRRPEVPLQSDLRDYVIVIRSIDSVIDWCHERMPASEQTDEVESETIESQSASDVPAEYREGRRIDGEPLTVTYLKPLETYGLTGSELTRKAQDGQLKRQRHGRGYVYEHTGIVVLSNIKYAEK